MSRPDFAHEDIATAYQQYIDSHGFLSWLGLSVETVEDGRVVFAVPYDGKLTNPASDGVVHGGVAASLVDTASGFALRTTFDDPATARLTTTDLDVSYLRPATGDLRVEAEVIRAGSSMGVTDALVTTEHEDGETVDVAVGRTSYRLMGDA
ncbi:PaaI family thioesterase [Haloarchaeobius salinus]|uniref:PaaI family thioesterase n=1 Tax=Haloarchaeobius salinus TaxID=1198298 RepID=UPI00210DED5B|nr:PaaI family thioesterase [Haloarchaeobius salinus]